ncbi:TM0106 family RecB-like putative nuclease [uncultured Amnibacterium sp.]|uniref:TM0106 family RecB-like putative nuclease n=1 Tax=uncultured Amnibacterium sp. TaxID=1631851 RepID=UPI0035C9FF0B
MFVLDAPAAPRVVRSASDLKASVECEWGLMRRLDAKLGRVTAVEEPEDALNRRAALLGDEHELRELRRLVALHGDHVPGSPGGVAQIARPADSTDPAALSAAQQQTLDAIHDGADVVFQGTFFDGAFLGFADFLMRDTDTDGDTDGDRWRVVDTKLARRAKVTALLQIAAYAQQLRRLGVPVAPQADLMLGDGTVSTHRLTDIVPVHALRQQRLDDLIAERLAATGPIAWDDPSVRACSRCAECAVQIEATRDVLLVGRLTVHQRDRLLAAGITTIDRLAIAAGPVEGLPDATLRSLQGQARMQLAAPPDVPGAPHRVLAEVRDASGLAALPAPDAGDIFFDFEGDPLWTDDDTTWGLDYLFGVVDHDVSDQDRAHRNERREHFRPFWAHDRSGERQALLDFLHYVADRRNRHPGLHVYHYADYERSHLQQLCARYGVGEAILDELLSEHVLVDLYPIVTRSIRISDRSYSLKKLEPLYMGGELRQSEVTTGAGSVDAYVSVTELRGAGRTAEADALLAEIADYNRYDCVSTLRLRDWLLARADEHGVPRRIAPPARDAAEQTIARREDAARDALLAAIEGVDAADRTADQTAIALAAAAIEYHRREAKSYWWEHFNRQISPLDEWAEQRDVLIVEYAAVRTEWAREPGRRSDSRVVVLVGRLATGSTLAPGDTRSVMYDEPVPAGCDPVPSGQRGEHGRGIVREVALLADGRLEVVLQEVAGQDEHGPLEGWQQLPVALTPPPPIRTAAQREAILDWGEGVAGALGAGGTPGGGDDAVLDVLRRSPPRLRGGAALHGPAGADPGRADPAAAIVAAVSRLDDSYVAVQGPPGSGKTTVGAHVIVQLVQRYHWRIGVVAQSHAVVENLLQRVIDAGLDPALVGKRPQQAQQIEAADPTAEPPAGPAWTALHRNSDVRPFLAQHAESGCVLGGTGWDFANATKVPRGALDLLVIDEAGQYSLANTVAVAVSARRLLLLGDPQQLPQVSQGRHPEPVDASALGWLSAGHDVLPAPLGFFLAQSWRMHPALCAAVSDLSYEGRLRSKLPETTDRDLPGIAPGVHPVPVVHAGDASESTAEAAEVVRLVTAHLGLPWSDGPRSRDSLTQADLIVVAPYNAQVALIRTHLAAAGYPDIEVGTVDKFQGREAVIAIVSLTASSAAEVPRGIGFVLLRNRLNVAISRAKWAAYLIHSPALADTLPTTAPALADLSAFLRLVGRDGRGATQALP